MADSRQGLPTVDQPSIPGLPAEERRLCPGCQTVRAVSDFRAACTYCRFCFRFQNSLRLAVPYDRLLREQDGLCKICGVELGQDRRADVDHIHVKPEDRDGFVYVRGLLCSRCNNLIGAAEDRPELLRSAAIYLEAQAERFYLPVVRVKRKHRSHGPRQVTGKQAGKGIPSL